MQPNDTAERMALAEKLGWREISAGHRVLGCVPGPAGFPPHGTMVTTLPSLEVLKRRLNQKKK